MITIFVTNNSWRALSPEAQLLAEVPVQNSDTFKDAAEKLAGMLHEKDFKDIEAVLALPSNSCLSASINTDNLPRKDRQQAMVFRLEDKLPLPAEEIVADFITNTHDALGCCIAINTIRPIVEALESKDIVIQTIAPASILALQHYLQSSDSKLNTVVWQETDFINIFVIEDSKPIQWTLIPANQAAIAFQLKTQLLNCNKILKVACLDLSSDNLDCIQNIADAECLEISDLNIETAACQITPAILAEKPASWINFRQEKLAAQDPLRQIRQPLNFAITAATMFLLALSSSFFLRAQTQFSQAEKYDALSKKEYRKVFKNKRVPMNIRSRLESEATKLAAINGEKHVPNQTSALTILYEILRRLPNTMRYQILKLHINNDKFLMDGKVRTLADVDKLASSLRKQSGFMVNQPRAQKNRDRGVDFTLRAQIGDQTTMASNRPAITEASHE